MSEIRTFMEDFMRKRDIPDKRIKEIADQDEVRFETIFNNIKSLLKPGIKILDVVADNGHQSAFAYYLKSLGHDVTTMPEADYRKKWDFFQDESFDLVFALEIVEHMNPLDNGTDYDNLFHSTKLFLSECLRVLKTDGTLMMTTPNATSWENLDRMLRCNYPFYYYHFMEYSIPDFYNLLIVSGFNPLQIRLSVFDGKNPLRPEVTNAINKFYGQSELRDRTIMLSYRKVK